MDEVVQADKIDNPIGISLTNGEQTAPWPRAADRVHTDRHSKKKGVVEQVTSCSSPLRLYENKAIGQLGRLRWRLSTARRFGTDL